MIISIDDGPDVIIPDKIARPLLVSSNLMVITAIIALTRGVWPLALAAMLVWITSLMHWHAPRFSSWRRYADYAAVACMIAVGSWVAIVQTRSSVWTITYFAGLSLIGVLFLCNETIYYYQLQRTPLGGQMRYQVSEAPVVTCLTPTPPGSAARRWAYCRAAWVHLLCVHVLASALANVMLLYGLCPERPLTFEGCE